MPSLIFTDSQARIGGVLNSRVLIGRRLSHGIVLSDPGVSRLHAWIDPIADEHTPWVISDAGSKTGTFVNDEQIVRHPLRDGDQIRVGHVTLTYHDQDELPPDVTPIVLSSPMGVIRKDGILFECACGAPLWVGNDLAGKRGMCRHCRQPVTVPALVAEEELSPAQGLTAPPLPPAPPPPDLPESLAAKPAPWRKTARCAICHSAIGETDTVHQCTDCAMTFHLQCWRENFGCSSYGCPQVNILQPADAQPKSAPEPAPQAPPDAIESATPWELILLASSIVATLIGALLFGTLAAIVAGFAVVILIRKKAARPGLVMLAIAISLVGVLAGLALSDFWWMNARHLPAALVRRWM